MTGVAVTWEDGGVGVNVGSGGGTSLADVAAVGDTYAAVYRFDNVYLRRGG